VPSILRRTLPGITPFTERPFRLPKMAVTKRKEKCRSH
jgi:hypothetical protein